MGIMDKAKEMLGMDETTPNGAKDAANKAGDAAKSKTDQVSGKASDAVGGLKDKAKGAVDSAKDSVKNVAPDSMDKHVDKGADAAKEGINKIGS